MKENIKPINHIRNHFLERQILVIITDNFLLNQNTFDQ
jgi:hypothetical protein